MTVSGRLADMVEKVALADDRITPADLLHLPGSTSFAVFYGLGEGPGGDKDGPHGDRLYGTYVPLSTYSCWLGQPPCDY